MPKEKYLREVKGPLISFALRLGYKPHEVEDIYQDYCLYVLMGRGSKQKLEHFLVDWTRAKLGRHGQRINVAQMVPCSTLKWDKITRELKSEEDPEFNYMVKQIISKLSDLHKEMFYLNFICNFEIKTAGKMLGMPYSAAFFHFRIMHKQCIEIISAMDIQ